MKNAARIQFNKVMQEVLASPDGNIKFSLLVHRFDGRKVLFLTKNPESKLGQYLRTQFFSQVSLALETSPFCQLGPLDLLVQDESLPAVSPQNLDYFGGTHLLIPDSVFLKADFFKDLEEFWKKLLPAIGGFRLSHGDPTPALLLDRDGVIIEYISYLKDPAKVALRPGIADAIKAAHALGHKVIVLTNQAGIAKGLYGYSDYQAVTAKMLQLLAEQKTYVDHVYPAFHHPEPVTDSLEHLAHSSLRKPSVGLLRLAEKNQNLDLSKSTFVGDNKNDMTAGLQAGVGKLYFVESGIYDKAEFEKHKASFEKSKVTAIQNLTLLRLN